MIVPANTFRLEDHSLTDGCHILMGRLPAHLVPDEKQFHDLWNLHPAEFHVIKIGGRLVNTPRWQQAYDRDYAYTVQVNKALPVPAMLTPMLAWAQETVDARLNGILVNWYDGIPGHYIGRHRDSISNLCVGTSIVTLSFGAARTFRLRAWRGESEPRVIDFAATNGIVFVMPWQTNLKWTHEVPKSTKGGRRISVTFRAFEPKEV